MCFHDSFGLGTRAVQLVGRGLEEELHDPCYIFGVVNEVFVSISRVCESM